MTRLNGLAILSVFKPRLIPSIAEGSGENHPQLSMGSEASCWLAEGSTADLASAWAWRSACRFAWGWRTSLLPSQAPPPRAPPIIHTPQVPPLNIQLEKPPVKVKCPWEAQTRQAGLISHTAAHTPQPVADITNRSGTASH